MKVGSGQAVGTSPTPALAEQAVREALARAGLTRAERVLLFLSKDFARQLPATLRAAAAAATCLQIDGCSANGVLSDQGWQIDRSAAVALVFSELPKTGAASPLLSFSGQGRLAWDWQDDTARIGLVDSDTRAWQQARENGDARCQFALPGLRCTPLLSRGLRRIGERQTVSVADAHELRRLESGSAADSLLRALPGELRARPPIHQLCLLRDAAEPGIGVLSLNSDGSLTLTAALQAGDQFDWAIRQPLAAEQEMRQLLDGARTQTRPEFALMLSCIGRGPLFYGGDDRDLALFRETFPDLPMIGAYGIGQIFPGEHGNRLFHNAVLTLLYERNDVQPLP